MARVKGSREFQYKVVRYRPARGRLLALAMAGALLMVAFISAWVGYARGVARVPSLIEPSEPQADEAMLAELARSQSAQQEFEAALLGAELDKQALEQVRGEVVRLRQEIASLQEENQFYRNLMSPEGGQRGLNFGAVEIVDTERAGTFRFKIVMQQLGANQRDLQGTLSVNIIGRKGGEITVLPLKDLSSEIDATNIKLKFRYFQTIEGELTLPDGFQPERIELEARSSSPRVLKIEKRFGWLVQRP